LREEKTALRKARCAGPARLPCAAVGYGERITGYETSRQRYRVENSILAVVYEDQFATGKIYGHALRLLASQVGTPKGSSP
jgi:hypothetical protein